MFSIMTNQIGFSTLVIAILSIGAGLAGLYCVLTGSKMVLHHLYINQTVSFGGRDWKRGDWDTAMRDLAVREEYGHFLDRVSSRELSAWRRGRGR